MSGEWREVQPGVAVRFRKAESGRLVLCGLKIEADTVNSETLRAISLGRLLAHANLGTADTTDLPPLTRRPAGVGVVDFYRLVADHYGQWAATVRDPARKMADGAGVPVTTVHRWIREARLRGALPPGTQGVAG